MTLEAAVLALSGLLAISAGLFVFFFSPGRFGSSITGLALSLLGLEQLSWARATYSMAWGGANLWIHLSLAFALPVSLTWVLLSITLARGPDVAWGRGWRVFVLAQALVSLAAAVLVHRLVPVGPAVTTAAGDHIVELRPFGRFLLGDLLLNLIVMAASFESTYLHLPAPARRGFRPGMLGVLLLAGFLGYAIATALQSGTLSVTDMGIRGIPVVAVTVLLPLSLFRGRIAEATVEARGQPIHKSASLLLAVAALLVVPLALLLTRATGLSLARGVLAISILGLGAGIAAIAVSNRLQRHVGHLIDPYLHRPTIDERSLWSRLSAELEPARTLDELYRLIPPSASSVAGIGPVTLYVVDRLGGVYLPVATTLAAAPQEPFRMDDPLPTTLRRMSRPIDLRGRADDLQFIPIYVENARQIAACQATCAVPLAADGDLFAFLLCGRPERGDQRPYPILSLLEVVARQCADRLEYLRAAAEARGR